MFHTDSLLIGIAFLVVLSLGTGVLALYRYFVARHEDTHIHVGLSEGASVERQMFVAQRLAWIDRWGKTLTVGTLVYFFVLLCMMLYVEWLRASAQVLTQ